MTKLPNAPTPAELRRVSPALVTVPKGTRLARIYFRGGDHPANWSSFRDFGPTHARFDHHDPPPQVQSRAVLYGARNAATCVAEVFQRARVIDLSRDSPWLVFFATMRPITLLDLTGAWPTRAGASMAIHSGPRARARDWARAIHAAYPAVAGLLYCSSMDANRPAMALFERARPAMPTHPLFHRALADPGLRSRIAAAASRFGYTVR